MALSKKEKEMRARQRMIDKAREMSTGTYIRKHVAPIYQEMIRAEYAALPAGFTPAMIDGELTQVFRNKGECVCITCGKVLPWKSGLGGMHAGHFLASRRNSILFVDDNVRPQCSSCNRYRDGSPQEFRQFMLLTAGEEVVNNLHQLKNTVVQFTREELVDMKIEYANRLKLAEKRMKK